MRSLKALSMKLSAYVPVNPDDLRFLTDATGRPQVFEPRRPLRFDFDTDRKAYLIEEGWAYTYKILPDGSRQVIDIGIAGDFLGMRGILSRQCDYLGEVATSAVLCEITPSTLEKMLRCEPQITQALLWTFLRDEAVVVEHLVNIGRRTAIQRLAHFFLELWYRMQLVGLCGGSTYRCPLSQALIADALGLTPIHVNRTIRELREANLLTFKDGHVDVLNERRLVTLSGYDRRYLDHTPEDEFAYA